MKRDAQRTINPRVRTREAQRDTVVMVEAGVSSMYLVVHSSRSSQPIEIPTTKEF